ncbi:MAG: hypothetical protein PVH54_13205 [Gammaproteobacteria bacterium]|jgi:hypothetical protein
MESAEIVLRATGMLLETLACLVVPASGTELDTSLNSVLIPSHKLPLLKNLVRP